MSSTPKANSAKAVPRLDGLRSRRPLVAFFVASLVYAALRLAMRAS
jgi:hypothetical protein